MLRAFARLAFPVEAGNDAFTVTPPSYRFDIAIEEDLIEEVARLYGSSASPRTRRAFTPPCCRRGNAAAAARAARAARRCGLPRSDPISSFVEPGWKPFFRRSESDPLLNPIASHQSRDAHSLWVPSSRTSATTRQRESAAHPRLRVGRVYLRDAVGAGRPLSVAGVRQPCVSAPPPMAGARRAVGHAGGAAVDFFDVKADLENLVAPLPCASSGSASRSPPWPFGAAFLVDRQAGGMDRRAAPASGSRSTKLPQPPVLFEVAGGALGVGPASPPGGASSTPRGARYGPAFRFQYPGTGGFFDAIQAENPPIVRAVRLFSLYRGESLPAGRKSLAFRCSYATY